MSRFPFNQQQRVLGKCLHQFLKITNLLQKEAESHATINSRCCIVPFIIFIHNFFMHTHLPKHVVILVIGQLFLLW